MSRLPNRTLDSTATFLRCVDGVCGGKERRAERRVSGAGIYLLRGTVSFGLDDYHETCRFGLHSPHLQGCCRRGSVGQRVRKGIERAGRTQTRRRAKASTIVRFQVLFHRCSGFRGDTDQTIDQKSRRGRGEKAVGITCGGFLMPPARQGSLRLPAAAATCSRPALAAVEACAPRGKTAPT